MKEFLKALSELFFPTDFRCYACGEELPAPTPFGICDACGIPWNDGAICARCGKPIENEAGVCEHCKIHPSEVTECRSVLVYEGSAVKLIRALKFGRRRDCMVPIGRILDAWLAREELTADVLVFVPLSRKKLSRRGYNQAELIARAVSERIGVPIVTALRKIGEARHQAQLSASERYENVRSCFEAIPECADALKGKRVLLVDDVRTTGATIEACAAALAPFRPRSVKAFTLAAGRQRIEIR